MQSRLNKLPKRSLHIHEHGKPVEFCSHALERFAEHFRTRFPDQELLNPERTARRLIKCTRPIPLFHHLAVKRAFKPKKERVRRMVHGRGWTFVVQEYPDRFVVVTVLGKKNDVSEARGEWED